MADLALSTEHGSTGTCGTEQCKTRDAIPVLTVSSASRRALRKLGSRECAIREAVTSFTIVMLSSGKCRLIARSKSKETGVLSENWS